MLLACFWGEAAVGGICEYLSKIATADFHIQKLMPDNVGFEADGYYIKEMSQRASILNLDLKLRANFPHLDSQVYELTPNHHVIVVPREQIDANEFTDEFRERWRMIGDRVEIQNSVPTQGTLVAGRNDDEIGRHLEGIYLNRDGLITVLQGMCPDLPTITGIRDGGDRKLYIGFECLPNDDQREILNGFLVDALHGRAFSFEVANAPGPKPEIDDPRAKAILESAIGLSVKPIKSRKSVPNFIEEEEYWWFESLPGLFSGEISPSRMKNSHGNLKETACYVHSITSKQIDIRQLLFCYDIIYMEPPLHDGKFDELSFWKDQSISPTDLLDLIETGRVRLIHTQAEERGELSFLKEAYETNPTGVWGRRRTAAYMIADIVETADEYILGKSELRDEMAEVILRLAAEHKVPVEEVAKSLLFPEHMRRSCLEPFNDRGLLGLMTIGQGELFASAMKRVRNKEFDLEASWFGQSIHIAHMLDATFIPTVDDSGYVQSWIGPSTAMGERLNFYRSFNNRISAAWAANERRKIEKKTILPAVPLLDFNDDVSVQEILKITEPSSSRLRGLSLISRLSEMSQDEQKVEIERLSAGLAELTGKQAKRSRKLLYADAAVNIGAYAVGASLFPFSPAFLLVKEILKAAQKAPTLDKIISELELAFEEKVGSNSDLTFLSKVSRVAKIENNLH